MGLVAHAPKLGDSAPRTLQSTSSRPLLSRLDQTGRARRSARYLLGTVKGADLGTSEGRLVPTSTSPTTARATTTLAGRAHWRLREPSRDPGTRRRAAASSPPRWSLPPRGKASGKRPWLREANRRFCGNLADGGSSRCGDCMRVVANACALLSRRRSRVRVPSLPLSPRKSGRATRDHDDLRGFAFDPSRSEPRLGRRGGLHGRGARVHGLPRKLQTVADVAEPDRRLRRALAQRLKVISFSWVISSIA